MNYYILLKLDPKIRDITTIKNTLTSFKNSWSLQKNQGSPDSQRKAAEYLSYVSDINKVLLDDPLRRDQEADEAIKLLQKQKIERQEKLDELIDLIIEPTVDENLFLDLVKRLGGEEESTKNEVKARLNDYGKIISITSTTKKTEFRPKLAQTIISEIRGCLNQIEKKSLYDFLDMSQRSSCLALYNKAESIFQTITSKGLFDIRSTAAKSLTGQAKNIFKDEKQKELYDNSYAVEALMKLHDHLEISCSSSKILNKINLEKLLIKAKQLGVDRDIAYDYFEEYATKRKWVLIGNRTEPQATLKICGLCNSISKNPDAKKCAKCGQDLIQPCPQCGRPTPTEDACCSDCGCKTGDAPLVRNLIKEAELATTAGDLAKATACYDEALIYWSKWPTALEGRQKVAELRKGKESALKNVEDLVRLNKLEAAQEALGRFQRQYGAHGTEALANRLRDGLAEAQALFTKAEALKASGRDEDAAVKYSEALSRCADHGPAQRALATLPPPAPAGLKVALSGSTAKLTWYPVKGGAMTYIVRRKVSSVPSGLSDGDDVASGAASSCLDSEVPGGQPQYYAVFAVRGGVPSATPAVSGPHLRLLEPEDVKAVAGRGQVTLSWRRPPGAIAVEVWRWLGVIPAAPGQGTKITVSGDAAVDDQALEGHAYGYLVSACFADPAGGRRPLKSPGVGVTATPVAPPTPVVDLKIARRGSTVFLRWTPPEKGSVQIRQTRRPPDFTPGQLIDLTSAGDYGEAIPTTEKGAAQAKLNSQGLFFFIPLSVQAQTAVLGRPARMLNIEEVSNPKASRRGNSIFLTWTWPASATDALVAWRYDRPPANPADAVGGQQRLTKREYDLNKHYELKRVPDCPHYFSLYVRDATTDYHSNGVNITLKSGNKAQIVYKVCENRALLNKQLKEIWIELKTQDKIISLPPLKVVIKIGNLPLRSDDGTHFMTTSELNFNSNGYLKIDLPINTPKGYLKLFFEDSNKAEEFNLLSSEIKYLRIK
jgi:tetratricopeptide (TPR) repeat protein